MAPSYGHPAGIISIVRRWNVGGYPAVMGTGIVSVSLSLDEREVVSRILLVAAAALYAALAPGFRPSPAAVAATAVLGARVTLLGWNRVALVLLVAALGVWLLQLGQMHAALRSVTGSAFMPTVATESLAVLAALQPHPALVDASLVPWALGLALYVRAVAGFELKQLAHGRGDHWIAGGALAISTLATATIADALDMVHAPFADVSFALWAIAMLWLVVLVVAELASPRLRGDDRRWSTVFPLGMYAACSFVTATAVGAHQIADFARVWVWVAVFVWLAVAVRQGASMSSRSSAN
jgi:hypothetical protein